uniref:Uncharacterized protein n=1 Tax=Florenciella parvula TaxID=236787 RepID=A0A7S2FLS5_9STRA|mmetsp:Transcript_19046/g.39770  ORF Transcript_19046/g.39770 Transcript_19046/m.39770 type:complete len:167 (+) Transcript_19046:2-502(+)
MLVPPPATPFLNAYFLALDGFFSLFGVLSVALFSFYLHACVIVGLFKVGVRFFCITLHPMRYGKTLMNSFLFNSSVIVLCAIPVVQFCTYAFDGYARYTTISTLLGVQVKYLKFLSIFFENNVFVYIILVLALLSSMYLSYYHRDKSAEAKQLKAKMKGIKKGGCC